MNQSLFFDLTTVFANVVLLTSCLTAALVIVFYSWKQDNVSSDSCNNEESVWQIKSIYAFLCVLFSFNAVVLVLTLCMIIIGFGFFEHNNIVIIMKNMSLVLIFLPLMINHFALYFIMQRIQPFLPKKKYPHVYRTTRF